MDPIEDVIWLAKDDPLQFGLLAFFVVAVISWVFGSGPQQERYEQRRQKRQDEVPGWQWQG